MRSYPALSGDIFDAFCNEHCILVNALPGALHSEDGVVKIRVLNG